MEEKERKGKKVKKRKTRKTEEARTCKKKGGEKEKNQNLQ